MALLHVFQFCAKLWSNFRNYVWDKARFFVHSSHAPPTAMKYVLVLIAQSQFWGFFSFLCNIQITFYSHHLKSLQGQQFSHSWKQEITHSLFLVTGNPTFPSTVCPKHSCQKECCCGVGMSAYSCQTCIANRRKTNTSQEWMCSLKEQICYYLHVK